MIEEQETIKDKYRGEAEATEEEIAAVGGKKSLLISNHFFQSNADAQNMANILLARLKNRKKYFGAVSEFCPAPIELGDTIAIQERIAGPDIGGYPYGNKNRKYGNPPPYQYGGLNLNHLGVVRDIKLSVTPTNQSLTLIIEVNKTI